VLFIIFLPATDVLLQGSGKNSQTFEDLKNGEETNKQTNKKFILIL
jgi:hypothetical protein